MKKLKNYEILVRALDNFPLVNLDINVLRKGESIFKRIKESMASGWPLPYLSFIEENNESFTLKTNFNKTWDGTIEYSLDTKNWSEWDGTEISSSNDGKLYLRGTGNSCFSTVFTENQLVLTNNKRIQCLGNIENLLDYATVEAGNHPVMDQCCYTTMFLNCTSLTKAPELPAIELTRACYYSMFTGCTSLTKAPELPATTLAEDCYHEMFYRCTSLIQAPKLPATALTDYCYTNMFGKCASLARVPELPAMTLTLRCYDSMFEDCTSLTAAPEKLPATTLAFECYNGMFKGCASLAGTIHCPASTANDSNRLDANAQIPANTATVVYDL